jgi:dienelactone hydrolase
VTASVTRFYRKGRGPAVIVMAEIPGITPHVLGFAERTRVLVADPQGRARQQYA